MTLPEKLAKLVQPGRRSEVSRAAGLPPNAVSDYVNKGHLPRVDTAFALAKAIGVSLDYLADDALDEWEPKPGTEKSASEFTDGELMRELARRFRNTILDLQRDRDSLDAIDWQKAIAEASRPGKLSDYAKRAMEVFGSFQVRAMRLSHDFDVNTYSMTHHGELPGRDRDISDFLHENWVQPWEKLKDFRQVVRFLDVVREHPEWTNSEEKLMSDLLDLAHRMRITAVASDAQPSGIPKKERLARGAKLYAELESKIKKPKT